MRVIIVGVGGVGAMAAWRLAEAGHEVVALEQFRIDHDRGSSYGESRIVRRVYPDPFYTALAADAYALWRQLQALASMHRLGRKMPVNEVADLLLVPPEKRLVVTEAKTRGAKKNRHAGGLFFGRANHPPIVAAEAALQASGVPYERLEAAEVQRRFPAFHLADDEIGLFEPSMGYAHASDCVRAAVHLAKIAGAKVIEANPVTGLEPLPAGGGARVTVQSGETFEGDRLLITAGPWIGSLLASRNIHPPLQVTRQTYIHLKPGQNAPDFEPGRFPVWIDAAANAYGFPHLGSVPGVKIALHHRGATCTPETVDRTVQDVDREAILAYARQRFPWLSDEVTYEKVCLYTNTPDEDFIIDQIPGWPEALIISACSGHGFKFAPLIGQIAADLAVSGATKYDLSRFRLARFLDDTSAFDS